MSGEQASVPPVPLMPLLARDPVSLGPFRLLGRLGSGGMGTAFLAQGPSGWVVVKEAHAGTAGDPSARARFRREVDAMQRAQGPWMAKLIDSDLDAEIPWVAMEFVPGKTLAQAVDERGPLGGQQLQRMASELAEGLKQIHSAGVLHRDLKPSNIMLSPSGVRLIDLGVAEVEEGTQLTRTGSVVGTTGWMAPEQVRGDSTGPATDVHAWGLCVLFAATGTAPFGHESSATAMYKVLEQEPIVPESIDEPLRGLVVQALAKDPRNRPTIDEIQGSLTQTQSAPKGTGDASTGHSNVREQSSWSADATIDGQHRSSSGPPWTKWLLAGVLLLVVAGLGIVLLTRVLGGGSPEAQPPSSDPADSGPAPFVQAADNSAAFDTKTAALDCLDPANQASSVPDRADWWLGTCDQDGAAKYYLQPAFIDGRNVTDAVPQLPQEGVGGWVISLSFDSEGAQALTEASQELYALPDCAPGGATPCNAFAIVLDGIVVSAPRFNEPITGGQAQIEGDFTAAEAQDLAEAIKSGEAQVTFRPVWTIAAPAPEKVSSSPSPADSVATPVAGACRPASDTRPDDLSWPQPPTNGLDFSREYTMTLETNCGDIVIDMLASKAPETVNSMVFLTDEGFFDMTICHRLTTEGIFVLQCGDPAGNGTGGPGYTIPDENLPAEGEGNYPAGTVAMANAGPGTGGSQFFIVYDDMTLPSGYTVWGKVTKGLDVVRQVADAGVKGGGSDGPPAQTLVIERAVIN